MSEDNKKIVRRVIEESINKRNSALAETLFAASYEYHGPGGMELRGPEGFQQMFDIYSTAFPDMRLTIDDMVAEGDKVVTRWTARGTHEGDLMGIAPTGRPVTVSGILVSRIAGGKIVEEFENFDELGMLRQIGVTALPAAATTA